MSKWRINCPYCIGIFWSDKLLAEHIEKKHPEQKKFDKIGGDGKEI